MRILGKCRLDNRGSITVEMCFVMPIIIAVVIMLIMLLLRGVNEGTALGLSQLMVYQCSDDEASGSRELTGTMVIDKLDGSLVIENKEIYAVAEGATDGESYSISSQSCRRERARCSDRLRRWQLYGDTIWE